VKFCQFLPVYIHTGLPISVDLFFNKMAFIFLGVLIIFTVSSFKFQQVRLPWLHRQWWVAAIYLPSVH